ncbi:hypothetical protein LXA43DRAFT_1041640 [Ganoderma leucocontextum]|nr:hypothetical protein LXA43DRAFT_1041640 [Ganoderma leucocontextum]
MRTLCPEFSWNGNTCTVVASPHASCPRGSPALRILDCPTPSHSNWVHIGGDPGRLGNWPDVPNVPLSTVLWARPLNRFRARIAMVLLPYFCRRCGLRD